MNPFARRTPPHGGPLHPPMEPSNTNVLARTPHVNPDGSISTLRSVSLDDEGPETILPTVSQDGRLLSVPQAIQQYVKSGQHLGKYWSRSDAERAAQMLHDQQDLHYTRSLRHSIPITTPPYNGSIRP